jgi:4-hydroxy-2-oxoglutarate aldolase
VVSLPNQPLLFDSNRDIMSRSLDGLSSGGSRAGTEAITRGDINDWLSYNLPPATGIDLSADLLVELSQHPNIMGVKDTSGNMPKMGETIRRADPSFQVLAGSANFFYPSLAIGVTGGILALANVAPDESVAMFRLFNAGEIEKGRDLHLRMLPVNLAITSRFGVGGLKAALDMVGFYGGPPRLPLLPLDDERRQEMQNILKTAGLV